MKLLIDVDKDYYEMLKYNVEHGQKYKPFEIIANGIPQEKLADDVWKLYEKYHSHLATKVLEFGDELKELLGKYQRGDKE